jgi:type VI secretion system Hcp family effector
LAPLARCFRHLDRGDKKMNSAKQRGISLTVLLALSVAVVALNAAPAAAQTSTYMKVDGITGSATDPRHIGWINIASLGQSASMPVQASSLGGTSAGHVVGACDVEVLKGLDAAGPLLWAALFAGKHIPTVTIEVWMTTTAGNQVKVYDVKLTDVLIASINAASAVTFAETVRMSGGKIVLTVTNYSPTGSASGTVQSGWNCAANTAAY